MMDKSAYLQVTRKCNNACIFCSNPAVNVDYTLEEAQNQVCKLISDGIETIMLTGGEPTECGFLQEIVRYIAEKGLRPILITNGVNLNDKILCRQLYDAGIRVIHLSLHSHSARVADKLSQREGHWKRQIVAIQNLLGAGFELKINSTINSMNCKKLHLLANFIIRRFPSIRHFVFNALDPGNPDGSIRSRAGENQYIVPRLVDMEYSLNRTCELLLSEGRTFRVERVPLCYMSRFADFSTETRKIVKNEMYYCSFIEEDKRNRIRKVSPSFFRYHPGTCRYCSMRNICAGIQKEYVKIYGDMEVYPLFDDPEETIRRIKNE